jgi:hypothetical protein
MEKAQRATRQYRHSHEVLRDCIAYAELHWIVSYYEIAWTYITAPLVVRLSSSGILSDRLLEMVAAFPSRIFRTANSPLLPPLGPNAAPMTFCPASHASSGIVSESSCPYTRQTTATIRLNKSSGTGVSLMSVSRNAHMGSKHLDHLGERSCRDLSGEGDRRALVGDVVGEPATVAAR